MQDDRLVAYGVMETIGKQSGIDTVRMYNREGKVTFSTDAAEVGKVPDPAKSSCHDCHHSPPKAADAAVCPVSHSRVFQAVDGHRALGVSTAILNEKSCWTAACHAHPQSQRVLGVLDLALSLSEADQAILVLERQTLALAGVAMLVLISVVLLFVRASVLRPVHDLLGGTARVAEGNLAASIPIRSGDELGALSTSFNQMVGSLSKAQGELAALMGTLEKQVEDRTAALKQAQAQLVQSEKMSSLGKLSASIAHEINNPLMGILTIAKLLIRTAADIPAGPGRETSLKQLRMVQRETERCSAIVRNLLEFARQRPLTLKEIDVNAPLEEALSVAANQMTIQGVKLEKVLGEGLTVQADLGQIRQAILNVALNAIEAMPKGGSLKITSRAAADGGVEVEVADNGPGIPPEIMAKVFDPFFTTKEKGTGLGLSVVFGIVQRHGGKLDVQSEVGKGTTMTLRLPRVAPAEAQG